MHSGTDAVLFISASVVGGRSNCLRLCMGLYANGLLPRFLFLQYEYKLFYILSVDLSSSVDETESTIALLLDRMMALEIANQLQQEQIEILQNTVDEQALTIVQLEDTVELLQSTNNSTHQCLDTVERDIQGIVNLIDVCRVLM